MVLVTTGVVSAKYFHQQSANHVYVAKEFYFTSDLLREELAEASYTLNANATEISFELRNSEDELRVSEDDLKYLVVVSGSGIIVGDPEGVLSKGEVSTKNVKIEGLQQGETCDVTVTAVSVDSTGAEGYSKNLRASFYVKPEEKGIYKHLTVKDEYVLLTVWTEGIEGEVSIECAKYGLIPDSTDEAMESVTNYSQEALYSEGESTSYGPILSVDAVRDSINFDETYSSHGYRFFLDKEMDISVDDFIVTITNGEGSKTAVSGTP